MAFMLFDVAFGNEVMKPMSNYLSQNRGDDWSEVEEPNLLWTKIVQWCEEYRKSSVDSDDPCKCQEVIDCGYQNDWLRDDFDRTHDGLEKGVSKPPRLELFNSNHTQKTRFSLRLFARCNSAIVVGLFNKQNRQDQTEACLSGIDPEWNGPGLG